MIKNLITAIAFIAFAFTTNAQQGTLDTTFNIGTGANSLIRTSAIQSDGKIIIAGEFNNYNGTSRNYIARLNVDGTNDLSFNIGTGANGPIISLAILSDGKIIIAGNFSAFNGTSRNRIARLNASGTLDLSFNPGSGPGGNLNSMAVQSDGKIIIGGLFNNYNGTGRNNIARINTDGAIDNSFNPGPGTNSYVRTISIQSDGKIIIGGDFTTYYSTSLRFFARLNADGTIDYSFNTGNGPSTAVQTSYIQSDGKIIIGGDFQTYFNIPRSRITRVNTNGSLDFSFNPGAGANNTVYSIAVQTNGKIIIGGLFTTYNNTSRNRIAHLNADGSLDNTFNSGTGVNNVVYTTSIQKDGHIIVGGLFTSYNGTSKNRLTRIIGDFIPCTAPDFITQTPNANNGQLSVTLPIVSAAIGYELQWRLMGTTTFNSSLQTGTSKTITGLNTGAVYQIRAKSNCTSSNSDWTNKTYNLLSGGTVACPDVSGLSVTAITNNSVSLAWNAATGANSYELKYRQAGPGNLEQRTSTASNSITLNGLNASTQNYFYVRTNCTSSTSLEWIFISQRTPAVPVIGNPQSRVSNTTISIYPNPAKDILNIETSNSTTANVQIISTEGKLVKTVSNISATNSQINVSELSQGVYFLRIQNGAEVITQKFVKE